MPEVHPDTGQECAVLHLTCWPVWQIRRRGQTWRVLHVQTFLLYLCTFRSTGLLKRLQIHLLEPHSISSFTFIIKKCKDRLSWSTCFMSCSLENSPDLVKA